MAVGDEWIEEFLWRGRPPGSAQPSGWHIKIGKMVEIAGKESPIVSLELPMARAAELGWELPEVLAAINSAVLAEVETRQTEIAEKDVQIADLQQQLADATAAAGRLELAAQKRSQIIVEMAAGMASLKEMLAATGDPAASADPPTPDLEDEEKKPDGA